MDIWSLGCILYELCTLQICFYASNEIELIKKINSGVHGKIDLNIYNDYLQKIIDLTLKKNDKERPSIEEVCSLISQEITLNQFKKLKINNIDDLDYKIWVQSKKKNLDQNKHSTWGDYVINSLLNKKIDEHIYNNILIDAAIIGLDGKVWSGTKSLNVEDIEFNKLNEIISEKSISIKTLMINNKEFEITSYNDMFSISFKNGDQGGTIARTIFSFVLGIYDQNKSYKLDGIEKKQNSDLCKFVVEDLAKLLIKINY